MGKGGWWATVHGVTKSRTQLSTHTHTSIKVKAFFLKWSLVYICLLDKYLLNNIICQTHYYSDHSYFFL